MINEKNAQSLPHGGDWAGFEIEYGREPLDFSMNVNPLGIPKEVQEAIANAGPSADRYPDPLCRELTQRLADHEQVPSEWIFCGNGAADIIFRLAQALKPEVEESAASMSADSSASMPAEGAANAPARRVADASAVTHFNVHRPRLLITAPTFSEYEAAFVQQGWEILRFPLREENGFQITEEILEWIGASKRSADVVFLCEPNNPTGVTTDRQLLRKILRRCGETGTMLVIDECFNGFLEEPEQHTMKPFLGETQELEASGGLILLKAFTKLFGMAGVRLGYCLCADRKMIERIRRAGPPWNVSSLAQAAGIAALDAKEHVKQGTQIVRQERPWLLEQLRELGITRVYGEANYLLFYVGSAGAAERTKYTARTAQAEHGTKPDGATEHEYPKLDQLLRERGVLIRDCSNYPGLGEGWYRIAVRTHDENVQLIEAIKQEQSLREESYIR